MLRRRWFGGGLWKPKNPHSLDHLKYLYNLLARNQVVTEQNKSLLVETLRSIAEILIWGDQNDSTVFDFFLEKNMLSFFLKIMRQKCGSYVCVQLLQTLNILFENIRNETSLYYLLSNNHVNFIIVHKFDFSDEEVMAYYISFLKTLSFKLNAHTIHFFYNEHTHDFPLYTEAIKFFNHNESMVRIAVRTLTLNVYRVEDRSMLKFIRDKTAAPYFSNLVWFIGNHVLELDSCVRNDADHQSRNRLSDLVAEHLDHLHYLNDILCLQIDSLNDVLTDHLLNRLLIPLYVYSLTKRRRHSQAEDDKPHVSSVVSLFLLSQVFLIISHVPLVRQLADIILNRDIAIFSEQFRRRPSLTIGGQTFRPGFIPPPETLEKSLENRMRRSVASLYGIKSKEDLSSPSIPSSHSAEESICAVADPLPEVSESSVEDECFHTPVEELAKDLNITDEEKEKHVKAAHRLPPENQSSRLNDEFSLINRPYLEAVFNALEVSENDYAALFAVCLLYALGNNPGIDQELLDTVLMPTNRSETKHWYNVNLVDRLIKIISSSCQYNSKVRLATLDMSILLVKQLVIKNGVSCLQDRHLAAVEGAREESTLLLRNFYKSEEIFLDMFEDEHRELKKRVLNVEYLMMDSNLLLPPTGTPLTGIDFYKRLPCGEVERARRTIRIFFLLRDLSLTLRMEQETQLPLTNPQACIHIGDVLDLNNSDLIACTVISKDSQKIRRFLVIDVIQLVLVEPDTKRLGWGIAKFVGFLQDVEVIGDKDDSRCLHVTIHRPLSSATANRVPLLSAKFVFDDHIRCMAAKQRLTKGRLKARQRKMHLIARLLELPGNIQPCPSPPAHAIRSLRHSDGSPRRSMMPRSQSHEQGMRIRTPGSLATGHYKPMFTSGHKVPGFAAAMRQDSKATRGDSAERERRQSCSPSGRQHRSREASPNLASGEEIPLENMAQQRSSRSGHQRKSAPDLPPPNVANSTAQPANVDAYTEPVHVRISSRTKLRSYSEPSAPKTLRVHNSPHVSLVQTKEETDHLVTIARLVPPCLTNEETAVIEEDGKELQVETSFFACNNATTENDAGANADANQRTENELPDQGQGHKMKGAVMNV